MEISSSSNTTRSAGVRRSRPVWGHCEEWGHVPAWPSSSAPRCAAVTVVPRVADPIFRQQTPASEAISPRSRCPCTGAHRFSSLIMQVRDLHNTTVATCGIWLASTFLPTYSKFGQRRIFGNCQNKFLHASGQMPTPCPTKLPRHSDVFTCDILKYAVHVLKSIFACFSNDYG